MQWALVLAGGVGSRFWPASTPSRPKQLLPLASTSPLVVETVRRLKSLVPPERTLLLTGEALAPILRELLVELPPENILVEPSARSTAPALAWGTHHAAARDPEAVLLSLHADWAIRGNEAFRTSARRGLDIATRHDSLVTVGVHPTRPDTGFGYILPGDELETECWRVASFVEKPDAEGAAALIDRGALWNSGMFAWSAARFRDEVERHAKELRAGLPLLGGGDAQAFFDAVEAIAIDHAVLERSDRVAVIPAAFEWDDVGTWPALSRIRPHDADGNVVVGDAAMVDARDAVVWSENGFVVVAGLDDVVVVNANGIVLVATKERAMDLKRVLEQLPEPPDDDR